METWCSGCVIPGWTPSHRRPVPPSAAVAQRRRQAAHGEQDAPLSGSSSSPDGNGAEVRPAGGSGAPVREAVEHRARQRRILAGRFLPVMTCARGGAVVFGDDLVEHRVAVLLG